MIIGTHWRFRMNPPMSEGDGGMHMPLLRRGRVWYALCLFCMLVPLFVHPATIQPVMAAPLVPASSTHQWTQATPTALLIANTADGITLTSADTALRQFLETTMGWTVTLKDDDLVQASDAAAVNVVVISASIDSYKLDNDFTYVTTPMVVNEYALYDQLGMTNGASGTDYGINSGTPTTTITLLDPTHPLAGGKSGTITVQSQSLRLPYGRPVNQGVKVANLPGSTSKTVLFGYDTGATMTIPSTKDGGLVGSTPLAAPARRVGLFLDADTPLYLTSDGWDLVRSALLWAIGQTPPSGTPTPTTVAPTATPAPETATAAPATATATSLPPTATATNLPPTVTPPSGAGKNLLLVVGSVPLGSGDAAVLQRLTDAQYTVQVIPQTSLTLEATQGMHGVLISSTVSASAIGMLLTTHPVPVLTWEYALYDDLRMTGTSSGTHFGTSTGSTLSIAAPTHPIAAGLSGVVSVSGSAVTLAFGQPLAQATLVAALPNAPASAGIFTYAQGAALSSGTAPARRAGFFFDNTSPTTATATGWALFERSVAWLIEGFTPIQPATATPTATVVPSPTPTASPTIVPSVTPVVPPSATPIPTATPLVIPPDPAAVAPALSAFTASDLFADTAFLYTGTTPIQTGVAPDTITAQRVAVIRGRVLDRTRQPIPGVQITIKDHPEFGMTHTRADGMFDLVVNGGSRLVVQYQHPQFLRVQRAVTTPWRDSVWTPEVVLTPLSPIVTTIQLGGAAQAAEGTVSTDDRGTRQARLFFPAGITATLRLPSGATQPLTSIAVRASEYTVGDTGRAAMPGELPSNSGYTYAAEFSADEALAVDGSVEFSQAVANYTENFMGFPVGMAVPTGWYDAQRAVWVPSPNGRIIAVLTTAPLTLDLTGDGVADDPASLGIGADEQAFVASTYSAGTSLWRVPMTHFTPWDHNWPFGPPDDAVGPNGGPLSSDPPISIPCEQPGSVITCETQSVGEEVALAGTPFRLVYTSDPAAAHHQEVVIPLSGATIPNSLTGIDVTVQIGGQQWTQAFSPSTNLATIFTWDGLDAYGRMLQGSQSATIKIGFTYPGQYRTPAQFGSAFGQFGTGGISLTGDRATEMITVERVLNTTLGRLHVSQNAIGGWSLDIHHQYDTHQRILYRGDGSRQRAEALTAVTRTGVGWAYPRLHAIAPTRDGGRYEAGGSGSISTNLWEWLPDGTRRQRSGILNGLPPADGQLLSHTEFNGIRALHTTPTGEVYLTDEGSTWGGNAPAIYRITADQRLERVVGGTTKALTLTPDGAVARTMPIGTPLAVDVDTDGTVWFIDAYTVEVPQANGPIIGKTVTALRVVRTDGQVIHPVAPTQLRCGFPNLRDEEIVHVTHDTRGNHYLALRGRYPAVAGPTGTGCILRIDAAGTITRIAGRDTNGQAIGQYPEGWLATESPLIDPNAVHVHSDGRLIVQDIGALREILPDGEMRTIVGNPSPSTDPQLDELFGSMVGPNGQISFTSRAVKQGTVAPPFPGVGQARLEVPSSDGSEVYVFASTGRHLLTRDAMTGVLRYTFLYDTAGRLTGVRDQHGQTTTITRIADGTPTAVVSPDGVTTTLTVGSDGSVQAINDPTQSRWQLQYQDGLLTRLIDPRNPDWQHQYTYTADGHLSQDIGATGGWTALDQTRLSATTTIVTSTTATGIMTAHRISTAADGTTSRMVTTEGRPTITTAIDAHGNQVLIDARGMRRTTTMAPDPRWGMTAPYPAAITVTNPAGQVVATATMHRSVVLSDPTDPWSLVTWQEVFTQHGLTTTTIYTAATRTRQVTLPSGVVRVTTYNAAGQPITETATDQAVKSWTYQPDGRLASDTIGTGPTAATTTYAYTPQGFIAAITNALGETTTYTHDAAGRIATVTHPTGHTRQY
ncbi:MAG TPA: hypothetical protein DEF47_01725, partial [Herpetosiphon sp.]|nr:hypothetical protein [Herpetosiphon sp.]